MRISKRQLLRLIREEHQGYDAREDESLAAEHGAASEHDQDYADRRDDAEFEERDDDADELHIHIHNETRFLNKLVLRRHLKKIIREERAKLFEDSVDSELDHLKKNVHDDIEHIRDLKDDIEDDHEEEVRAEKEKHKHESLKRRLRNAIRENTRRRMRRRMRKR